MRIGIDGARKQFDCRRPPVGLGRQHREIMEHARIGRIVVKNVAIGFLRRFQVSGPVKRDRLGDAGIAGHAGSPAALVISLRR